MKMSRELRNADEAMSTQLASEIRPSATSKNSDVRKKSNLEAAASAEATLYDYEVAVSKPDFDKYREVEKKRKVGPGTPSNIPRRKRDWNTRERGSISTRKTLSKKPQALRGGTSIKGSLPIAIQKSEVCRSIFEEVGDSEEVDEVVGEEGSETVDSETSPTIQKKVFGRNVLNEFGKSETDSGPSSPSEKEIEDREGQQLRGNIRSGFSRKPASLNTSHIEYTRNSKIPRARFRRQIVTCQPVQVFPIEHSSVKNKSKDSILERQSAQNESADSYRSEQTTATQIEPQNEAEDSEDSNLPKKVKSKVINASRISLHEERASGAEADEEPEVDNEASSRDVSPAVIDAVEGPSTVTGVGNLKLDYPCRSCDNRKKSTHFESNVREARDPWSDSHSSPEMRTSANGWSKVLKNNVYTDSSSEEMDLSSDYSSDNVILRKKRNRSNAANTVSPFVKSTFTNTKPSKTKNHCRTKLSFFNALFDIVFWPFLFLKTNR